MQMNRKLTCSCEGGDCCADGDLKPEHAMRQAGYEVVVTGLSMVGFLDAAAKGLIGKVPYGLGKRNVSRIVSVCLLLPHRA
jgi:hypothetical protein